MEVKQQIIQQLGYTMEELPFKYLGVPLSTKKMNIIQWYPPIDKIMARINSWTPKKLSYAGRTQLIKTVLFGVKHYWAQLFIIPAKIIKVIKGLCRSYLWSGVGYVTKKALIAWEKVCCPKSEGGIGLINMRIWNRAAIAKMCWDLANKEDKLWIKWIHTYYIKGQREWQRKKQASWMIQKVMNAQLNVEQVQQLQRKNKGVIRLLYDHMMGEQQKPIWTCLMFNNAARPKAYFIMWIMMNQRLVTVDRLAKWGVEVQKTRVLCKNDEETAEHLITQCSFARRLWGRLLSWTGKHNDIPMTWEHFVQW
ncbi:uncharacterized protein [Solanum lycopersicum]|uniref:uncharacterized protein n=1 Tax=Solanum lycopersicum TaxID=4081 RepID=UPI003748D4BB